MADPIQQLLAEIQAGDGLGLSAAGRLFPGHRANRSVGPATVLRWITKGTRTADGRTIKLGACRVGCRWVTSRAAVARYVTALSAVTTSQTTSPTAAKQRTEAHRRTASERAAQELARRGA